MKTLLALLIIVAFLQTTILPFDLVVVILILRSVVKADQLNLYLGFGMGLLVSHLSAIPIGVDSIIYLVLIQITRSFAKSQFSENIFLFLPLAVVLLIISNVSKALIFNQSISLWPEVATQILLAIPVYYALKLWEERFIFKKEIKLRYSEKFR
ncbi:hypothetical protein HYW42_03600 [Candidatus Daviesbacteria bacterium]|nr:hypothetical protein [Candidatus Daviesbacteria bacterium]